MPALAHRFPAWTVRACWLGLAGAWVTASLGAEEPLPSLRTHSPFVPAGSGTNRPANTPHPAATTPSTLELQGIYQLNGRTYCLIFDAHQRQTSWARENDPESPYEIVAFDPRENAVTLRTASGLQRLVLAGQLPAFTSTTPPPVATGMAYPAVTPDRLEYIPGTKHLRYLPDQVLAGLSEPDKAAMRRQYTIDLVKQGILPANTPLPPEYGQTPDAADTVAAMQAKEDAFRRTYSTYRDDDERRAREAEAAGERQATQEP